MLAADVASGCSAPGALSVEAATNKLAGIQAQTKALHLCRLVVTRT